MPVDHPQPGGNTKLLPVPDYPIQMMSSDYFELGRHQYLVLACRYSGWSTVYNDKDCTSKELVSRLRDHVGTFGVMDDLATDGASVNKSPETLEFLSMFGIKHRVASAYNPHSNQLAEETVKAARRMVKDNPGAQGTLDTNKFLAALLTHRNKPDPETTMSSSNVIFGRRSKDPMPIRPDQLRVAQRWAEGMKQQEVVMARRHLARGKKLNKLTRELAPLKLAR